MGECICHFRYIDISWQENSVQRDDMHGIHIHSDVFVLWDRFLYLSSVNQILSMVRSLVRSTSIMILFSLNFSNRSEVLMKSSISVKVIAFFKVLTKTSLIHALTFMTAFQL